MIFLQAREGGTEEGRAGESIEWVNEFSFLPHLTVRRLNPPPHVLTASFLLSSSTSTSTSLPPSFPPSHSHLKIGAGTSAASNFVKKLFPNAATPRKGLSACIARAWPGTSRASGPCMTAMNRSVVGSGPTRWPGKSRWRRERMKDVFPTEY